MTFSLDAFRLDGKVAIVTGVGGHGNNIGRAYALGLAQAGAAVVVCNRDGAGADEVRREIEALGGKAIAAAVDITRPDQVGAMVAAAVDAFGTVDILINNAAQMVEVVAMTAAEVPIADWSRMLEVNVTGALICAQAVLPMMRQRRSGKIVNTITAGAFPCESLYGVSKLALYGLTTTLARQHGHENINVNAIAPGNTMTGAGSMLMPEESPYVQFLKQKVAMRLRGKPDELVGALLLLCSSAGDWITGQVFHVDGGWVIGPS